MHGAGIKAFVRLSQGELVEWLVNTAVGQKDN
jgi:hypothetical protein